MDVFAEFDTLLFAHADLFGYTVNLPDVIARHRFCAQPWLEDYVSPKAKYITVIQMNATPGHPSMGPDAGRKPGASVDAESCASKLPLRIARELDLPRLQGTKNPGCRRKEKASAGRRKHRRFP
jgi:hypothetical protein